MYRDRTLKTFKEGDLVMVVRSGAFTLCKTRNTSPPALRECPIRDSYIPYQFRENIEGKIGLVTYVARNRLEQELGYRVLFDGDELFCKSTVAKKYFKEVSQRRQGIVRVIK